ncbi:MAG: metallophosphoesterase [Ideonella sp.]|nr:metallophosphoesterase [Ideonella sp.]MCC7456705.1 metallophosphoesterase [Nitrospira sp.]
MRLQLLSDLHLETEAFDPQPAPDAELLVLLGDIDARWEGLRRFTRWPVPVWLVAGNHEFDDREWHQAWPALREHAQALGIRLLEREAATFTGADGRRVRVLATTRWSDFDLFGPAQRERAMRAAGYFLRLMNATRDSRPFDAAALRDEALACREWLAAELARPHDAAATLVLTHFAPSIASADPRYGRQPSTAAFCNDDTALLPLADVWLHGHLHCCRDYRVPRTGAAPTRVIANARGHVAKGEGEGFDPLRTVEV